MTQHFLPGFGYTHDIKPPKTKKSRQCPLCGSDREATRNLVLMTTGTKHPCNDVWHETNPISGRI